MILNLPINAARGYKSASQRTRVITETWTLTNMYCPACVSNRLKDTKNNTEAVDFTCTNCKSAFQLKAKSGAIGRKIVDAGYNAMIRAIMENRFPHFLVLSYNNLNATINDLLLIPSFCFPTSAIEARKPLNPTARRAGWVGCNIILGLVPPEGRIPVINSGNIISRATVRNHFRQVRPLENLTVKMRGWTLDVLTVLRSLKEWEFTLEQAYAFEKVLSQMHPKNQNVRAKIRQQLQILRDIGYLQFVKRGRYRWVKK
jgi:type II restriction enzyme